ncbi:MAG TPA: aminotransferase class I/II-fold pyridoxal phosphate-dependent enzyme [Candidatus Tectomicrobia bacterium]|jgi:alanine-synthesizing transaminase
MHSFVRIDRLPPYVFAIVDELKLQARRAGEDIIDLGMGNPDNPPPQPVIDKLCEAANKSHNHRYSASRGITKLRRAIAGYYYRRFGVELDPDSEVVTTIGVKEGFSHLMWAIVNPGDLVMVPTPAYPIHMYGPIFANGDILHLPLESTEQLLYELQQAYTRHWPRPKVLVLNFPHNPTTTCVDMHFFEEVVAFAREHQLIVIHDFAYADLVFDGYQAPSLLQVPGAKEVGLEFFSMSKSFNMPGWRVGFALGNPMLVGALRKIKSYLDYGIFQPVQIASIIALNEMEQEVETIRQLYERRRNALVRGLQRIGWPVQKPPGTMFLWARIPEPYQAMGSLEFCQHVLKEAKVAVAPGIGFGEGGDQYVRFALVENEHRTRQALRGLRKLF